MNMFLAIYYFVGSTLGLVALALNAEDFFDYGAFFVASFFLATASPLGCFMGEANGWDFGINFLK